MSDVARTAPTGSLNLTLRPPRDNEWTVCRMLLPETFDGTPRTWLLCLRNGNSVAGAVSFVKTPDALTGLRVHVIPPLRRTGVATWILSRFESQLISGMAEILHDPSIEAFCERVGFRRTDALTTVESDIAPLRSVARRIRQRLTPPPEGRVVPLSEAPVEQVARLHTDHVARQGSLGQWRGLVAGTAGMEISPVAMLDDRVVGILLGAVEGTTAVVRSRVVAPGHHGTWVNAMLLAEALEIGWQYGARRARFTYNDENRDTQKLAHRAGAKIVSVVAHYVRNATVPVP